MSDEPAVVVDGVRNAPEVVHVAQVGAERLRVLRDAAAQPAEDGAGAVHVPQVALGVRHALEQGVTELAMRAAVTQGDNGPIDKII